MKWLLTILALGNLLFSVIICLSIRYHNVDAYTVIVAVLTLLVTILIGWQIYNAMEVNKRLGEMQRVASKIAYEENKKYNHTTIAVIHYINALDFYKRQNFTDKAVDELFCCIEEALKGKFQFPIDMAISCILEIPDGNLIVMESKRKEYIRTLYKLNCADICKVITKIEKAYGI